MRKIAKKTTQAYNKNFGNENAMPDNFKNTIENITNVKYFENQDISAVTSLNFKLLKIFIMKEIKNFSKSQKLAYLKVKSGTNCFITGVAGTGKTYFLNKLRELFPEKKVFLTASTGAASLQLEGGKTVSSFLGLVDYTAEKAHFRTWDSVLLDNSIIVIDEISMIGRYQWNGFIQKSIKKNSKNFRTVQIIVAGDPAQMPPLWWDEPLNGELNEFQKIELQEIFRQKDKKFIKKLKKIRYEGVKPHLKWLQNNSGNQEQKGVTLVNTYADMQRLNKTIPKGKIIYTCDLSFLNIENKIYEKLEIWEGMKVLLTRNNFRQGYVNGDTGIVLEKEYYDGDEIIKVKLDRNDDIVYIRELEDEYKIKETVYYKKTVSEINFRYWDYRNNEEKEIYVNLLQKIEYINGQRIEFDKLIKDVGEIEVQSSAYYNFMPLLPAYFLTVRRAQGATLTYGTIDLSVILDGDIPTQYTAFSRFKNIKNIYMEPKFEFTERKTVKSAELLDKVSNLPVSNKKKRILIYALKNKAVKKRFINDVIIWLEKEPETSTSIIDTLLTKGLNESQFRYIFKNLTTYWYGIKKLL